jgi:heat shock protein HslJ
MFETIVVLAVTFAQTPAPPRPDSEALEGTWAIDVIDNINVMPEAPVTLTFRGARVSGMASCNSFQGGVTVSNDTLKFDSILTTMKACDAPRMSQERDFLAMLRQVTRYAIGRNGALTLTTAEGKRLSARKKQP